jgi:hypothetical protein
MWMEETETAFVKSTTSLMVVIPLISTRILKIEHLRKVNYNLLWIQNPQSNAFIAKATLLETEENAKRQLDGNSGRVLFLSFFFFVLLILFQKWRIVNPNKINSITGLPTGYNLGLCFSLVLSFCVPRSILEPGLNAVPYMQQSSSVFRRANYES